jgi:hypothetical protein
VVRALIGRVVLLVPLVAAAGIAPGPEPSLLADAYRAPTLARLFLPPAAPPNAYALYVSERNIWTLAGQLRALDVQPVAHAWQVQQTNPFEGFGAEGRYDRVRLARLFLGRRLRVARGSLNEAGVLRGYTLLSPYPDETLTRLMPGTMVIIVDIAALIRR